MMNTQVMNAVDQLSKAFHALYFNMTPLMDQAALEEKWNRNDCIEMFHEYEWEMKDGADKSRFDELKAKGSGAGISADELAEFFTMVCASGEAHCFFHYAECKRALETYREMYDEISAMSFH